MCRNFLLTAALPGTTDLEVRRPFCGRHTECACYFCGASHVPSSGLRPPSPRGGSSGILMGGNHQKYRSPRPVRGEGLGGEGSAAGFSWINRLSNDNDQSSVRSTQALHRDRSRCDSRVSAAPCILAMKDGDLVSDRSVGLGRNGDVHHQPRQSVLAGRSRNQPCREVSGTLVGTSCLDIGACEVLATMCVQNCWPSRAGIAQSLSILHFVLGNVPNS